MMDGDIGCHRSIQSPVAAPPMTTEGVSEPGEGGGMISCTPFPVMNVLRV
jgi:hypothetical protein